MNSNTRTENKFYPVRDYENKKKAQREQISNGVYRLYLIGFFVILLLPLLNISPWFSPPAWGKSAIFIIIISILIFLFIYQLLYQKAKLKKVNLSFWLLVALGGIFLLATIFSLDRHFSFWGSPYRGGGILTFSLCLIFGILTFLITKPNDWKKIWDITFITGVLVSLLAIFQKLELFSNILVPYSGRTVSTMGAPNLLGLYLVLLIPLAISFGIKNKDKKRFFYFFCSALFFIALLLSATKAALLGISVAFLFFIYLYPVEKEKKKLTKVIKISITIILILGILGFYWASRQPQITRKLEENKVLGTIFSRILPILNNFSIDQVVPQSRVSAWKISFQAIKERPILGYGPENFSIAFDKYYDPALPGIKDNWWDRAHNSLLDIAVTAGIPALLIYLSLLGIIFWQLWKKGLRYSHAIIAHGIQASFIGYLVANFFTFDTFSTYLISFLLIAYSLFLINKNNEVQELTAEKTKNSSVPLWKSVVIFVLFCAMLWFIWVAALKPLKINKEINWAIYYTGNKECQQAINKMEQVLPSHSIIDNYLRLQYINSIRMCMEKHPEQIPDLAKKGIEILDEAKLSRPTYTRTWLFLGTYINIFVENSMNLDPELRESLLVKASAYFQKANELSPKRHEVLNGWIKTDLLAGNYQSAKEKAQKCTDINPDYASCWWAKGLAHIYLNEIEEAVKNMNIAVEKGYDNRSKTAYQQLLAAYMKIPEENRDINYYKRMAEIYENLIWYEESNFQFHASLAYTYKKLGEYEKAAKEAVKVYIYQPESRITVEQFLKELPADYNTLVKYYKELLIEKSPQKNYNLALALLYKIMGDYQTAKEVILLVLEKDPNLEGVVNDFLNSLPK